MKITVIFTGGTIGSAVGAEGYIAPGQNCAYRLIETYRNDKKNQSSTIVFQTVEPYRILSENLTACELNKLIETVDIALQDTENKGIIVTHGTDTLQYTAAILSEIFGTNTIPIVLVSSDFPLEDTRANGYANFFHAVSFIMEQQGRGVFVSYRNTPDSKVIFHRGDCLLPHEPYSAAVYSVQNKYYGFYENDKFIKVENQYKDNAGLKAELKGLPVLTIKSGGVLRITPYVGMVYPKLSSDVKVVLHDTYHSGTLGISQGLIEFMREAERLSIPVYVVGLLKDEHAYETVREYKKLGLQVLPELSPITAYVKLWLAVSNGLETSYIMSDIKDERG